MKIRFRHLEVDSEVEGPFALECRLTRTTFWQWMLVAKHPDFPFSMVIESPVGL